MKLNDNLDFISKSNSLLDRRQFDAKTYTKAKVMDVPSITDLFKKQLSKRSYKLSKRRQSRKALDRKKILSNMFSRFFMVNKLRKNFSTHSTSTGCKSSKYMTISFDIKRDNHKLDETNIEMEFNEDIIGTRKLTNIIDKPSCNCDFAINSSKLAEHEKERLNSFKYYHLDSKKFINLSLVLLIATLGLMNSIYILQFSFRNAQFDKQ